jgi:protein-tyrosine phosphatase
VIDIHCHPLPGLDDGAQDWEASLEMAEAAAWDGVTQWIATPHWTGTEGEVERVRAARDQLVERLEKKRIPLRVHCGNEVILVPQLAESLKADRALTLAGSSYILLETAQFEGGAYIHSALFQLQSQGYRVILAHPERLRLWQRDLHDLRELVYRGCYLQVNAGSLMGAFGPEARKTAERLIKLEWVSFLASDAHSPDSRPPLLQEAVERCARLIGRPAATALVEDNPSRILCGEHLSPPNPEPVQAPSRWLPWLRR